LKSWPGHSPFFIAPVMAVPRVSFSDRLWPALAFLLMIVLPFVQREPAPYDFLLILAMLLLVFSGQRVPSGLAWPALCVVLILTGYAIGAMFAIHHDGALLYMRTSSYLSVSLLFFASIIWRAPERVVPAMMIGLVISATIAAIMGIGGYFSIPNAEAFALYGRAMGPFKDPNVFGPFLILPTLYLAQRLTVRPVGDMLWSLPLLLILLLALFLSFSRGAWVNFVSAALVFIGLSYATATSRRDRARLVGFMLLVTAFAAIIVAWMLSIEDVRNLFMQRLVLVQDYDVSSDGRFGSMLAAFNMALKHPLGIGPDQWPRIWGLMPHNIYVNVFVSGGLIAFVGFLGLTLMTLWIGLRALRIKSPFRGVLIIALAVFIGHAIEGFIIDTNHWRHLYINIGLIWGLALQSVPLLVGNGSAVSPYKWRCKRRVMNE